MRCDIKKSTDTYLFPVRAGMPEWLALSVDDRLKVCQLPDSVLRKISTEGLIQTWLDFPFVSDLLLNTPIQKGFDFYAKNFSGLTELLSRKNSEVKLFDYYKQMTPSCIEYAESKGQFTFWFTYIEILLAQDTLIAQLTTDQKKDLVRLAVEKAEQKNVYGSVFGSFGQANSLYICARILRNLNYQPFIVEIQNSSYLRYFLEGQSTPLDATTRDMVFRTITEHSLALIT